MYTSCNPQAICTPSQGGLCGSGFGLDILIQYEYCIDRRIDNPRCSTPDKQRKARIKHVRDGKSAGRSSKALSKGRVVIGLPTERRTLLTRLGDLHQTSRIKTL